jgi:hypothetical protein
MTTLKIAVIPIVSEIIIGESLKVDVELSNSGSSTVNVHSPESPSEFEYILRPDNGKAVMVLSARRARLARTREPVPLPTSMVPLKPGSAIKYRSDLADFAVDGMPAGNYRLAVAYRIGEEYLESSPVPLAVVEPNISKMALVLGSSQQRLAAVFSHIAATGVNVLFQRESAPKAPWDAVSFRRAEIKAPPIDVGGVASAVEINRNEGARWFAWLEKQSLGAGVGNGSSLYALIDAVPTGLVSLSLQEAGWQPEANDARFALVGSDSKGKTVFTLATFSARTKRGEMKTVPLSIQKLPLRWCARSKMKGVEKAHYDVITATQTGEEVRLIQQTIIPDSDVANQPIDLTKREEPLAAMAMYPVAVEQPGVADVLFGPSGKSSQMTFLRLPLDGAKAVIEYKFSISPDSTGKTFSHWTLCPRPLQRPLVVAKLGDRIIGRRLEEGASVFTIADDSAGAEHLHLEAVGEDLWAIWADPKKGIQYRQVPED